MEVVSSLIIGMLAGILVGIVPLIVAVQRDKVGLGIGGFFASALSGALCGLLLALPIAGLFTWMATRAPHPAGALLVSSHDAGGVYPRGEDPRRREQIICGR